MNNSAFLVIESNMNTEMMFLKTYHICLNLCSFFIVDTYLLLTQNPNQQRKCTLFIYIYIYIYTHKYILCNLRYTTGNNGKIFLT